MVKAILVAFTATVLLASSTVPSSAQYRYRGNYGYGGGWHGGGWYGGNGAALGLGLGLGFLGGALATAPYYTAPYSTTRHPVTATPPLQPSRRLGTGVIHTQYYPYVANCPTAWRQIVQ